MEKKPQPTSKNIVCVSIVYASVTMNQWSELQRRITAFSPCSLPWTAPSPMTGTNVFFTIYIKVSSGSRDLSYELKISFFRWDLKERKEAMWSFKLQRSCQGKGHPRLWLLPVCSAKGSVHQHRLGLQQGQHRDRGDTDPPCSRAVFASFLALAGLCSKSWRSSDGDLPSPFRNKGMGFCSQQHHWAKWKVTITHNQ